jgi:hypothetical protein
MQNDTFLGFPCHQNIFFEIFAHIPLKDQWRLLTTSQALYNYIPKFREDIDSTLARNYIFNKLSGIEQKELPFDPTFLTKILKVIELQSGNNPYFPMNIQYQVFSHLYNKNPLETIPRLVINTKKTPVSKKELSDLLDVMDKTTISAAIKELELFFFRFEDNLHELCEKLPNLENLILEPTIKTQISAAGSDFVGTIFSKNIKVLYDSTPAWQDLDADQKKVFQRTLGLQTLKITLFFVSCKCRQIEVGKGLPPIFEFETKESLYFKKKVGSLSKDNSTLAITEITSIDVPNSAFYQNYTTYDLNRSLTRIEKNASEIVLKVQAVENNNEMRQKSSFMRDTRELPTISLSLSTISTNAQKALEDPKRSFNQTGLCTYSSISKLVNNIKEFSAKFHFYSLLYVDNTNEILFLLGRKFDTNTILQPLPLELIAHILPMCFTVKRQNLTTN